jgi:hypothetical protein
VALRRRNILTTVAGRSHPDSKGERCDRELGQDGAVQVLVVVAAENPSAGHR